MARPKLTQKPLVRQTGYYWTVHRTYKSVRVLLHFDGAWHDGDPITEDQFEVLAGPLSPPTDAERARQPEHFAEQCRRHAEHYETDDATIRGYVNANYWVRRQSRVSAEIARFSNGIWFGLNWDDEIQWATSLGEPDPDVIFGPLLPPEGYCYLPRWK